MGDAAELLAKREGKTFDERFSKLPAMNERKFRRTETSFLRFGSVNTKSKTSDKEHKVLVLTYFEAYY